MCSATGEAWRSADQHSPPRFSIFHMCLVTPLYFIHVTVFLLIHSHVLHPPEMSLYSLSPLRSFWSGSLSNRRFSEGDSVCPAVTLNVQITLCWLTNNRADSSNNMWLATIIAVRSNWQPSNTSDHWRHAYIQKTLWNARRGLYWYNFISKKEIPRSLCTLSVLDKVWLKFKLMESNDMS